MTMEILNPIIVTIDGRDEIILSEDDVLDFIRERCGDEVLKLVQECVDEKNEEVEAYRWDIKSMEQELSTKDTIASDVNQNLHKVYAMLMEDKRIDRHELLKYINDSINKLRSNFNT